MNEQTRVRPFDALRAMQAHINLRSKVEAYVHGDFEKSFHESTNCTSNCDLAKWLHAKGGCLCKEKNLLDEICRNCENFLEEASQAVLMKQIGKIDEAKQSVRVGERDYKYSTAFQRGLVRLHLSCI